jgi:hypothetical protein
MRGGCMARIALCRWMPLDDSGEAVVGAADKLTAADVGAISSNSVGRPGTAPCQGLRFPPAGEAGAYPLVFI